MIRKALPAVLLAACTSLSSPDGGDRTPAKGTPEHIRSALARIDSAAIQANARTTRDWPSYGLDYAETRFSRLQQIHTGNVKRKLPRSADTP